ncbi:MAG: RsmB/NOP family class I SAM-dependent RNA methyltransferase [Hyphomicrobiales bacterium]
MRLPGRVSAAIEVLTEVLERHRPASEALKDWGKAHRFAGGGDRHSIGTLVYDALRRKASAAWRMESETPRALVLATLATQWNMSADAIAALAGEEHGPALLTAAERQALIRDDAAAPDWVKADVPQWLAPSYAMVFGPRLVAEGQALARRAPIDLRVNRLKATRSQVLQALQRFGAVEGPLSPDCVRIAAPGPEQRNINVEAEPAHGLGQFEVQDAASQIAALMSGVRPGDTVADICAGAGGKTLALAALMNNEGTLIAHDRDRHRLRPIFERITRAGASCIEVVAPDAAAALNARRDFDCVLIDAPCSGSGSWRRKPDAKWKFSEKQLAIRVKEQREVLTRGAAMVRPGGTLVYITCSVLPQENQEQLAWFRQQAKDYALVPSAEQWRKVLGTEPPKSADGGTEGLLMSPATHDTDGFFVSVLRRAGKG